MVLGTNPTCLARSSTLSKRACDACHRRKVKCIPSNESDKPCRTCAHNNLRCTFNAVPQKKGPKGGRARIITALRQTEHPCLEVNTSPTSPSLHRASRSLLPSLIDACVEYYFTHVYPTQPILHRASLQQSISIMYQSPEAFVLVEALVAYMCIQPKMDLTMSTLPDSSFALTQLGTSLLSDALEVRKSFNYFENPSATSVTTSFFFFGCYFSLEQNNSAWFHLREATTLAMIMGMHNENHYAHGDLTANILKRRLFWLLFVTERAYALQTQKPLTLHATIRTPTIEESPDESVQLRGFLEHIRLSQLIDDTFVGLWTKSIEQCNIQWIVDLQRQLAQVLPKKLVSTQTQAVDLRTSQQWLKIMTWQLSMSHRLLSSEAEDQALTLKFPVELSREMVTEAIHFPKEAMEVHGIGLVKKMFDVACTLVDVMKCVQLEQYSFEIGPGEYLNDFINIMSRLRGGKDRYLPILLQKANESVLTLPTPVSVELSSSTHRFVNETIDLDECQTSTSDDTDFVDSPDTAVADPIVDEFVMSPVFPVYTAAGPFNAPTSASVLAPTFNPFGG